MKPQSLLLIGNPLSSCPQGHFLRFIHLPSNPPVTLWPSVLCILPDKMVSAETTSKSSLPTPPFTPVEPLLIQIPYPSLSPQTCAQRSNCTLSNHGGACLHGKTRGHILEPWRIHDAQSRRFLMVYVCPAPTDMYFFWV